LHRISIHMEYTGDAPIFISSELASDLLTLEASSTQYVAAGSKEFGFLLNTEAWDGPFVIPYPLKVHYKGVTLDRTVVIKGNVFAPLTLTQKPSPFTNSPGQEVAVAIRNNTAVSLLIASVG